MGIRTAKTPKERMRPNTDSKQMTRWCNELEHKSWRDQCGSNDEAQHVVLCARLDNLGKGASGAAVQNLNIALGLDETAGL